jgi:hypothetical protein
MTTDRRPRLGAGHLTPLLLAGLLVLGTRGAAAQETGAIEADTAPMSVIVVVFPGQTAAKETADNMMAAQAERAGHVEAYAVVSKDEKGNLTVQDRQGKMNAAKTSARATRSVDGVVALLGRSPGGDQAGISKANADQIRTMLAPGNSAIIFVVGETWLNDMDSAMEQAHALQVLDADLMPLP